MSGSPGWFRPSPLLLSGTSSQDTPKEAPGASEPVHDLISGIGYGSRTEAPNDTRTEKHLNGSTVPGKRGQAFPDRRLVGGAKWDF